MGKDGKSEPSGAFITQKDEKLTEVKKEIAELEQLLAGANQTSQSTQLLKKRKEMREVDESLELMKKDYKKRMDDCEERRLQFELRQAKLREQVLKFEKFIQENDSKRQRAEMKAKHERKLYEDKCREMNNLLARLQELDAEQKALHAELESRCCFQEFLESVVEVGDSGYEEIGDILNRHRTLVDSNRDLLIHSADKEREVDTLRIRFQFLTTESQNHLLVSNSKMQQLQLQLEHLRTQGKQLEEEESVMEGKKKDVSRELSQVSLAIKNIHSRCIATIGSKSSLLAVGNKSNNSNNEEISSSQLMRYLDSNLNVIHERMVDLIEICKEASIMASSTSSNNLNNNNNGGVSGGPSMAGELKDVSVITGVTSKTL